MAFQTSSTEAVAQVVRAKAAAANRTPHALAENCGIPRTTLNRRLTGASPFTTEELFRIAADLGTSVVEIIEQAEGLAAA